MMKKFIIYILAIGLISCSKVKSNYDEYLPEVNIISATPQIDGSILVEAEILSEGEDPVDFAGFSCSATSTPELLDRQIITNISDNKFDAFYVQMSEDSTYQFRAWATNEYGYSYSNTITLDNFTFPTETPPCTLSNEYLNTGLSFGSGIYASTPHNLVYFQNLYQITGGIVNASIEIYLAAPLSQGLYTTSGSTIGYREMYVLFFQGQYYSLEPGSPIYVNKISPGVFDVTICDAPWLFNNSTWLNFNTRFTAVNP